MQMIMTDAKEKLDLYKQGNCQPLTAEMREDVPPGGLTPAEVREEFLEFVFPELFQPQLRRCS